MFLKNFHLTSAMTYLLHSVFSIVIGALVSFLVYIGSNAFTGTADLKAVLLSGLSGLVIYFTTHIGALTNSPQAAQAEQDALGEVKSTLTTLVSSHQSLSAVVNALVQAQQQPASAPAPQPAVFNPAPSANAPVPQLPFPTPAPAMLTTLNTPVVKP